MRIWLSGVFTLCGAVLFAQSTFRVAIDVVAVDVQVVDGDGRPVVGLGPEAFTVSIDGKRRKLISADFVKAQEATPLPYGSAPVGLGGDDTPPSAESRVVTLAIDALSFSPSAARGIVNAAQRFVARLPVNDRVGLFAFPLGPQVKPTTNHAAIVRALNDVIGLRDSLYLSEFHLRPSELIDLSLWATDAPTGRGVPPLVDKLCPQDETCLARLKMEVTTLGLVYEGQAQGSLGMLRDLFGRLGKSPGRQSVVLVSAGTITSDVPSGHPDLAEIGIGMGEAAARANLTVYTLFVDESALEENLAEIGNARNTSTHLTRDSDVLGRWLDQFSGRSGGAMMKVLVGNGDTVFDRIVRETSAYYLLGVEPTAADRDNRPHPIKVTVGQRGAIVRSRAWVVVPKPEAKATVATPRSIPAPDVPTAPPAPRQPTAALAPLAAAFERGETGTISSTVARSSAASQILRDFETIGGLWPATPRRDAVFAIELAIGGLRSPQADARDAAARMLVQYNTVVRQVAPNDPFECAWYSAEVAGLQGLLRPSIASVLIKLAQQRCPADPRWNLALAVVAEQDGFGQTIPAIPGQPHPAPDATRTRDITVLYEAAISTSRTTGEARARAAHFYLQLGQVDRALALVDKMPSIPLLDDPRVRYLAALIRGEVLRAHGDVEAAEASFREAVAAFPGAQAARVALMTLLVARGDRDEVDALARAVQASPAEAFDPWWLYWFGDFPLYPARLTQLREMAW